MRGFIRTGGDEKFNGLLVSYKEYNILALCYRPPTPVNLSVSQFSGVWRVPFRDPPTLLPRASGFADAKESFLALSASFATERTVSQLMEGLATTNRSC